MVEKRAGSRERKRGPSQRAEDEMIDCLRMERFLPDRERGWLYHITLRWPAFNLNEREQQEHHVDGEGAVRTVLSRYELRRYHRAFYAPNSLWGAVPEAHRDLFRITLALRAWPRKGGFRWEEAGRMLKGKDWGTARCDLTTDALRMRYEACLRCIAHRLDAQLPDARG